MFREPISLADTGELDPLSKLDGPVAMVFIPTDKSLNCVSSITATSALDGTSEVDLRPDVKETPRALGSVAESLGFTITDTKAEGNSLYDCG